MESNCIVVLLLLCRNIGIRDSEQQLLVYSYFVKHFSCCVDSAADPFWGYNVLIPWTILHSMNNACLNCTANTETSLPLHLPPGQAPSQYIHGLTSCSPYALVDVTCFPLMSCFPVGKQCFLGKGKWEKTQQFCLILANIIMTKPLNSVCPAEFFSPRSSNSTGTKHTRKGEHEQQLRCLPYYFYPHRWFALLPNIAEHRAINLPSFPRIICPQVTLSCFQIPPLPVLFPRPSVICFTAQYCSLTASPICLV